MVKSYRTYLPGEISRKWNPRHAILPSFSIFSTRSHRHRPITLSLIITMMIRQFGSSNSTLQRFIVHILQPIALSGVILLGRLLLHHPLGFIAVGAVSVLCTAHIVSSLQREKHETVPKITPENTSSTMEPDGVVIRDTEGERDGDNHGSGIFEEGKSSPIECEKCATNEIISAKARGMSDEYWRDSSEDFSESGESNSDIDYIIKRQISRESDFEINQLPEINSPNKEDE